MSHSRLVLSSDNPETTIALARAIAPRLGVGDSILLSGPVGAGKTHFARGLILALLDTPEDVPSPTYTLVQTYDTARAEIWHADLYRLGDPAEVVELGLTDAFVNAICLVEWPDRLAELAPSDALHLSIRPGVHDDQRLLDFTWTSPAWADKLKDLGND